jgi:hypothetical protein
LLVLFLFFVVFLSNLGFWMFKQWQMVLLGWFWTPSKLFSLRRFNKWIHSVVLTLFSYCTRSHSTSNCIYPWNSMPPYHDKAYRWSSFHCSARNIIFTHKPSFMLSIPQQFCNTFLPHQFGAAIKGNYEIVIHNIKCTLDLHPNWIAFQLDVANAFNSLSRRVIFQELHAVDENIIQVILLFIDFMHLNLHYFTIIIVIKSMSQSSHLPWEPIKVILWEHHSL